MDTIRRNPTLQAQLLAQWLFDGTGLMGVGPSTQFGWLRVPDSESFFADLGLDEDPSAGPTSAHFELIPSLWTLALCVGWRLVLIRVLVHRALAVERIRLKTRPSPRRGQLLLVHRGRRLTNCP